MILRALAEERKSENTGLQVMNVIKYQKPKTKPFFAVNCKISNAIIFWSIDYSPIFLDSPRGGSIITARRKNFNNFPHCYIMVLFFIIFLF